MLTKAVAAKNAMTTKQKKNTHILTHTCRYNKKVYVKYFSNMPFQQITEPLSLLPATHWDGQCLCK